MKNTIIILRSTIIITCIKWLTEIEVYEFNYPEFSVIKTILKKMYFLYWNKVHPNKCMWLSAIYGVEKEYAEDPTVSNK